MNDPSAEFSFSAFWARRRRLAALLAAGLLTACWWLLPPARAAAGSVFLAGLVGAALIDADHMIIPDLFTVGLAAAGLGLSALVPSLHATAGPFILAGARSAATAALGIMIGSALGLWLGIVAELVLDREAFGFGDVKFLGAIGAFCGWQGAVCALFGGALLGAAFCAGAAAARTFSGRPGPAGGAGAPAEATGRFGLGTPFPFGPMLAAAAALYFLLLHRWVDPWLARDLAFF